MTALARRRPETPRPVVSPTGSWWVDTQRPDGTLDGVAAAEEAARMIRADSSKTSHGGDK